MKPLSRRLQRIIEAVRLELKEAKQKRPLSELKARIKSTNRPTGLFSAALRRRDKGKVSFSRTYADRQRTGGLYRIRK